MRRWFQSRSPREQLLVTALVILFGVIWLGAAAGRVGERLAALRSAHGALATQQLWLDRAAEVQATAASAVQHLDPARTYDATRLVATVTTLAAQQGLTPTIDSPQTQRTAQFAYHSVRVSFRRAGLPALLGFYDELAKQAPYLSLESLSLQTDRGAPGQLNATLHISAPQSEKR